jgi:anti-sigma factor RsiW
MTDHLTDVEVDTFVLGEVTTAEAVRMAVHLDGCPACSARAAQAEPLSMAIAAVPDPHIPVDLAAAVLAEAAKPEVRPLTELGIGACLVAVAALFVALDDPIGRLVDIGMVASLGYNVMGALSTGFGSSAIALLLTALLGVVGGMAVLRAGEAPLDRRLI